MKPPNTCAKTTRQLPARIYEKHLNYSQTDTIMYHLSRWMYHWDESPSPTGTSGDVLPGVGGVEC